MGGQQGQLEKGADDDTKESALSTKNMLTTILLVFIKFPIGMAAEMAPTWSGFLMFLFGMDTPQ